MRRVFSSRRRGGIAASIAAVAAIGATLVASAGAPAATDRPLDAQNRMQTAGVKIRNFAFHPGELTVAKGTTVAFVNRDSTTHTATRAGSFNTGHIRPGRSATVEFKRAGVYAYHCMIHNYMHGKIVVK